MRDKNFDVDLLKTLNDQPMPETPLTDDEFTRVLDAACGRLPQKKPAGTAGSRGNGGSRRRGLSGRGAGQHQLCRPRRGRAAARGGQPVQLAEPAAGRTTMFRCKVSS